MWFDRVLSRPTEAMAEDHGVLVLPWSGLRRIVVEEGELHAILWNTR